MAEQSLDEAMLVIQEAARKIDTASAQLDGFGGKQNELIVSVNALAERVANLESAKKAKDKRTCIVPLYERNLVRAVYHDLSHSDKFKLDEPFESISNVNLVDQILTEVKVRQPSIDKEHVQMACQRYFLSLCEDHKRATRGTKEKHRTQQRRLRRKKQKLLNRRTTFEKSPPTTWSSGRKTRIKEILDKGLEYISSEESGDDTTLYTRPLAWIKSKYRNSMRMLDAIHYNGLSTKSKGMVRKREESQPSERLIPSNPLQFVIVPEMADDNPLDTSNASTEDTS